MFSSLMMIIGTQYGNIFVWNTALMQTHQNTLNIPHHFVITILYVMDHNLCLPRCLSDLLVVCLSIFLSNLII